MEGNAPEPYPWTRRDGETSQAYDAFREYMHVRSTGQVAERLGKSTTIIERWCSRHNWVERTIAYDRHMETASTDGIADELIKVRTSQLVLLDRMVGHVSTLLEHYITNGAEPTSQFTQFASMVFKAQESAARMRLDGKNDHVMEKILKAVERLEIGE